MNKRNLIVIGSLCGVLALFALAGCSKQGESVEGVQPAGSKQAAGKDIAGLPQPPVQEQTGSTGQAPRETAEPKRDAGAPSPTPLKDALDVMFTHAGNSGSAFPKGTHLLSVDLKDKTAFVDVSQAFNKLQNAGESREGQAQKQLCACLARFPGVDTLHLTVEGKDYESQAADWRNIPVRGEQADNGSAQASNMQAPGSLDR